MNCIKCNNPIPDGAKFCPSCGASYLEASNVAASSVPAPEPEKRYFCEKCGLELSRGVKFCSVCGGAAYAKDVSPISNSGDTFGQGNMSAVSLDKPSGSDDLVSAMNTAATAAASPTAAPVSSGVPMPADSFPAPSGVPTPSESGFSGGYSAPAPSFAPSANAADAMGGFAAPTAANMPNYGGTATAAAVRPVKKKHKGRVALIIIAAVVVLLGAAAVLFFTNRAGVLSTIMGKSKYAAMVEGTHIKQVTDKINIPAVADGIKTASSIAPLFSMTAKDYAVTSPYLNGMTSSISGSDGPTVKLSNGYGDTSSGAMSSSGMEMDLSAMEKMYAELLRSTYGKSSVSGSVEIKAEIGNSLKALMDADTAEEVDEVLKYLNGSKITYNLSADDDSTAVSFGTEGQYTINAKVLMDGQDMYISLPFVSDKAIKITLNKPAETDAPVMDIKPLELDEKELERIITDIVQIYLDHYKALEIEMDKGEIDAAGVVVSGKLITAEFSAEDVLKLAEDVCEYLANDDYLAEKIVEFINSCGADADKDDYSDALTSLFENVEADEDSKDKIVINTVINNNGDVLGKSLEVVIEKQKTTFSYAESKKQDGFEMKFSGGKITMLDEKTDDANGTCTMKVTSGGMSVSLELKYSDVKETVFCGKKTVTGKYELSMKLPEKFSEMLDKDAYAAMNGAKITMSISSDSENTLESTIAVSAPGYLDVSITETDTASDDTSELTVPSGVIDVTPLTKNQFLDDASAEDLVALIKDTVNKLTDMGIDMGIEPSDLDRLDPAALTGKVSKDQIDDLLENIDNDISSIDSYMEYLTEPEDVQALTTIKDELKALADKIRGKNYNITQDELYAYNEEFYEIYEKMYNF